MPYLSDAILYLRNKLALCLLYLASRIATTSAARYYTRTAIEYETML